MRSKNGKFTSTWQIDRHIPLALIFSMAAFFLAHTIAIVWWGAGVSYRLATVEVQIMQLAPLSKDVIRLEMKVEAMGRDLSDIKALLQQLAQQPAKRADITPQFSSSPVYRLGLVESAPALRSIVIKETAARSTRRAIVHSNSVDSRRRWRNGLCSCGKSNEQSYHRRSSCRYPRGKQ